MNLLFFYTPNYRQNNGKKINNYGTLAKHQIQCLKCQSQAPNSVLTLTDTARSKFTCVYAINLPSFTENLNPCIPSFWSWISILANDLIFSHIKWLKLYMYLILNFWYANDFQTLQLAAHKAFILDYDYSSICKFMEIKICTDKDALLFSPFLLSVFNEWLKLSLIFIFYFTYNEASF